MSIIGKEDLVLQDYKDGFSLKALEKKYHTDYRTIKNFLLENGIKIRTGRSYLKKDITGKKYNKLTAIKELPRDFDGKYHKEVYWLFRCDCGVEKPFSRSKIVTGAQKSCGCLRKDLMIEMNKTLRKTHGDSSTRLYNIWQAMKYRCYNKKSPYYQNYGGRGIRICEEWKNSYLLFREWALSNGYSETLSIDRINPNGNYEPLNCRWCDIQVQNNNRTTNHYLDYKGIKATLRFWQKLLNIPHSTLYQDLSVYEWNLEKFLNDKNIEIKMDFKVISK